MRARGGAQAAAGGAAAAAGPVNSEQRDASGVGAQEYRDVLAGTGAHSRQTGMLKEMVALFAKAGRTLIWQQDGARAHTVSPKTKKGKATRALIESLVFKLIDDWPAKSADLSPIENVWAIVEHRLWTKFDWIDLDSFKRALRAAWKEVTGDLKLMRALCGSWEKRREACIAGKGKKVKY